MDLKGRLALIAGKVEKSNTVADIGTDHAYIPIYLVENGVCKTAIASDVKKGPVKAATANIKAARLDKKIKTRLGNGLETISENEADVIIIAGMGGILVSDILDAGMNRAKEAKSLILQPMNRPDEVRKWLADNDFEIFDEELCAEGEKIYNVICARHLRPNSGTESRPDRIADKHSGISESAYFHIGKKLIEKNDPLLGKLLKKKIRQLDKAINEMNNAAVDCNNIKTDRDTYIKLRYELKLIENMIK